MIILVISEQFPPRNLKSVWEWATARGTQIVLVNTRKYFGETPKCRKFYISSPKDAQSLMNFAKTNKGEFAFFDSSHTTHVNTTYLRNLCKSQGIVHYDFTESDFSIRKW